MIIGVGALQGSWLDETPQHNAHVDSFGPASHCQLVSSRAPELVRTPSTESVDAG